MTDNTLAVTLHRASAPDAQALAILGGATFTETFGHLYPPEDLQSFLASAHSVEAWNRLLADPQRAVWFATLADETPISFIAVGRCKLPIETLESTAGEIHQLYVLAQYHNLGIGSRLMNLGLNWLEENGHTPLYVGVWSENYGAQRFYGRYGFRKIGDYGFRVGSTVDHEFILKRG